MKLVNNEHCIVNVGDDFINPEIKKEHPILKFKAKRVDRAWGHEEWIANSKFYCGKRLIIKKNHACSLHFHKNKLETMHLQSGKIEIRFRNPFSAEDYVVLLVPGDSIHIHSPAMHQIFAIEDSELYEFSTEHEESDSYRVEKNITIKDQP